MGATGQSANTQQTTIDEYQQRPRLIETSDQYLTLIECPLCGKDWRGLYAKDAYAERNFREHLRRRHHPEDVSVSERAKTGFVFDGDYVEPPEWAEPLSSTLDGSQITNDPAGDTLHSIRKELSLYQTDAAPLVGLCAGTIGTWEHDRQSGRLCNRRRLLAAYEIIDTHRRAERLAHAIDWPPSDE